MADKSTKSEAELFEEEAAAAYAAEDGSLVLHPETESQDLHSASATDDLKASSFDELQVASTHKVEDRLLDDGSGEEAQVPVPTIGDTYDLKVVFVPQGVSALDAGGFDAAEGDEQDDEAGSFAVVRVFTHGKGKEKEETYELVSAGLVDFPGEA